MKYLNFFQPKKKSLIAEVNENRSPFIVKSVIDQIVEYLRKIPRSEDNPDYKTIISEIKNHLDHKDVELLIKLTHEIPNIDKFIVKLEKEKYFWEDQIEHDYHQELEDARLSLCTSDYLAFTIGKKYDLNLLINRNSFWSKVYSDIDHKLSLILLQNNWLCLLEGNQKAHVPVNYALSMFLIYDTKVALSKFKKILNNDRIYRLEAAHQAEYFLIVAKFFDKIKLNFIPKINTSNNTDTVAYSNENGEYITREEIEAITNKEDYLNNKPFKIDVEYLLNPRNFLKKSVFENCFILFFTLIDQNFEEKNVKILISCLTEINPPYTGYEISNAQFQINNFINDHHLKDELIKLLYNFEIYFITFKSISRLSVLIPEFLNKVEGIGPDTIKSIYRIKGNVLFRSKSHSDIIATLNLHIT
jgi:hypothetical protein